MRTGSLLFLLGIIILTQFRQLPSLTWVWLLPVFLWMLGKRGYWRWPAWLLCGFLWGLLRADFMLDNRLDRQFEGRLLQAEGRVVSLPEIHEDAIRFDFQVEHLRDQGGASHDSRLTVRLNWYRPFQQLLPGEQWRLSVRLKRPYGFMDPGGIDYEGYLFQEGLGATGYVVNRERNDQLAHASLFNIHQLRYRIRAQLEHVLGDHPMRGLVAGLAIGDLSQITPHQWHIMTNTGINHLLAISGLHIGLIAGLAFFLARSLWPLGGRLSLVCAGPRSAAIVALITALCYSLLAGFSLPTQRTMIMLGTVVLLTFVDRMTRNTNILALSLLVTLVSDPFAVMSVSFWLSFLAVAVIAYGMSARAGTRGLWWQWGRVQWLVAVGLAPVLIFRFQQISLVGVLANLLAVPWVSLLSVPLVLAGIAILQVHAGAGAFMIKLAAGSLALLWNYLELIGRPEASIWQTAAPTFPALFAMVIGVVLLLMPRGLPGRWLGVIWLVPVFLPPQPDLAAGQFRLTLLDVGQGLAAVVHTRNHTLLYDTGPSFSDRFDAGGAVVLPYLRYSGIKQVDKLIASHGDSDHIGGLPQVLAGVSVAEISSSVPEKIPQTNATECKAGDTWDWDGVHFSMLYPDGGENLSGNNRSCVLRVSSGGHSLLLTGDIQEPAEKKLIARYGMELRTEVLVAPHHGSNTSSSAGFISAVAPSYVLFPVGYRNRYGFPKQDIINSYRNSGASTVNTAAAGAIEVRFTEAGLQIARYRQRQRRFWHTEF